MRYTYRWDGSDINEYYYNMTINQDYPWEITLNLDTGFDLPYFTLTLYVNEQDFLNLVRHYVLRK